MAILEMGPALLMATQEAGLEITAWKCPADETGDTECTWDACNGGNTCGGDNVIVPTPILKEVVQTWADGAGTTREAVEDPKSLALDEGSLCGGALALQLKDCPKASCPTPRTCAQFGCLG